MLVFERLGGSWVQAGLLREVVSHSGTGGFGISICVNATGDTVAIGSPYDWRAGYEAGAVFIFKKSPTGWTLEAELFPAPVSGDQMHFGLSVALNASGDRVVGGAPGYVVSGNTYAGAVLEFARVGGTWQQVGTYASPTSEKWGWFGWTVAMNATGSRWCAAEVGSDVAQSDAGLVHVFNSTCTQPAAYCTAQTNSLGCMPQIDSHGTPSASKSGGFRITTSNTRNQRTGILFYGTSDPLAQPWSGGTLCVQPPLRRTAVQSSGGNPTPANDCSGAFAVDFNSWRATSLDPALFAGQHVFAQYLSRDPSPASQTNLTDAVEFYLEP